MEEKREEIKIIDKTRVNKGVEATKEEREEILKRLRSNK